ncbi:hypothetical protein [Glutamicibacter sp.]|uniref:hypothetical protein n=1 Tax=Glutamicibacter sp. TaxID=1931995 RepID=UPI002B4727A0|nr:hypothetical protein [Glutamicibacter sp.]HJX77072.1 hypothetical protein [Glutamicibacter sp.]
MSKNHLQVLAKDPGRWTASLNGEHVATCSSRTSAYQQALKKAEELGNAKIIVHDEDGELDYEETYP